MGGTVGSMPRWMVIVAVVALFVLVQRYRAARRPAPSPDGGVPVQMPPAKVKTYRTVRRAA